MTATERYVNKTPIALAVGASLMVAGCASLDQDDDVDGRLYVGAGALISELEPDTDAVPGVDVDESRSGGASVLLGYDVNHRFSIEGNYARLGEATLSPDGEIDYSVAAVSGLLYGLSDRADRSRREGFSAFARAGIGQLDNASGVPFEQVNDFNALFGLGVEYGFRNGLAVRGEVVSHDRDVAYAQLALVYRIGDHDEPPPEREPVATERVDPADPAADLALRQADIVEPIVPAPVPVPVPVPEPEPEPEPLPGTRAAADGDGDGVPGADDRCGDTSTGRPVDASGCDLFDGPVDGVEFESGSDTLTANARRVLDGIAATLAEYSATRIAIEAHTDNRGTAENNLQLSRRRAIAVASYLVTRDVAGDRLMPRAFGESRPRVPNASAEGRASNRRVELRLLP